VIVRESREPQSDETCLYIKGESLSLWELIQNAGKHFPDTDFDQLHVGREHFHARCIGYDRYDPWDYDDYITITRNYQ